MNGYEGDVIYVVVRSNKEGIIWLNHISTTMKSVFKINAQSMFDVMPLRGYQALKVGTC